MALSQAALAASPQMHHEAVAVALVAICAEPSSEPALAREIDALEDELRAAPESVRASACAAWPASAHALAARLAILLAEWGLGVSHRQTAIELLRALGEPGADADPSLRAAWHLASGRAAHEGGEPARALVHFDAARRALQQAGRERTMTHVRTLIRLAHAQRGTQQVDAAAASLDEAERLLDAFAGQRRLEMADLHNARTMVAYSRLDREAVVRHARAEYELLRDLGRGDSPSALHALGNLGGILSQLERPAQAEAALREGLHIMDRHPDLAASAQVGILVNLAALELTAARYQEAVGTARRGVQTARRFFGEHGLRQVTSLVQHAKAQTRLGRYDIALSDYAEAEDILRHQPAGASRERLVWIREGQADVHGLLGDEPGLLAALEDGLRQSAGTASLRRWRGALLRNQGVYLARRQRWVEAASAFTEAARVFADHFGPRHAFTLELQAALCITQLRSGGLAEGCAALDDASSIVDSGSPRLRYAAHSALAARAQTAGSHEATQHHLLLALAAAQQMGGPHPLWEALAALAAELRRQQRNEVAVFLGKQAVQAVEALRSSVHAGAASLEGAFLADKLEVYRQLASWLATDERLSEAMEVMRLLREEEFHQFMLRGVTVQGTGTTWTPREQVLSRAWATLPPLGASMSPSDLSEWTHALRRLIESGPSGATSGAAPAASQPAPPVAATGLLRVTTISRDDGITLVLESARRREALFVAWPRAALGTDVAELLSRLESGGDALPLLQRLYVRIGSVLSERAREVSARRIELALDGALRYVPFAALHDGQAFLGAQVAFSRLSAAASTAAAARPALNGLQAFGSSLGAHGLAALPSVGAELCAIVDGPVHRGNAPPPAGCSADGRGRGSWPGRGWLDAAFTLPQLERSLAAGTAHAGGLLHLGTHFILKPGNVVRSWLQLGDGQRLHLSELGRLNFSGQALVTLASCETAVGTEQADGREVEGLSSLVLHRGAGAVLASLWRVDDRATRMLMEHFYRSLRQHPPPQALQRAQAALRAADRGAWSAPRYWAGFIVAGRSVNAMATRH